LLPASAGAAGKEKPASRGGLGMFHRHSAEGFHPVLDGIEVKTPVFGECMLLSEFRMKKGSRLPRHAHPQEQTGRLMAGRILLSIGGEQREMAPGDCWSVPAGVEHGAEILEDSAAIEVFSPVREDYKKYHAE
jgi:quercetin dioxygenase-like cupin family protein